jgi:hypothetical protein
MARKSPKAITIDPNVRCLRVYPAEETDKSVKNLKTVGLKLSKEQGVHLARVLLAVTQEWDEIEITAYRLKRRMSDGTYQVTVTSFCPEEG